MAKKPLGPVFYLLIGVFTFMLLVVFDEVVMKVITGSVAGVIIGLILFGMFLLIMKNR